MKQIARCVVWVDPDDCIPPHNLDMNSKHDSDKVNMLANAFIYDGFDKNMPALVGYPLDGKIQLISGTHRHCAAKLVNEKLPITLWLRSDIEESWGTDDWANIIKDISVKELEALEIELGFKRTEYDAVNLNNIEEAV